MSQLRIVFAGVGAITPAHPAAGPPFENPGPLAVVFPSATRRQTEASKNSKTPAFIPVHFPVILSTLQPRRGSRRSDDPTGGWHIWHPVRERLVFKFEGAPSPSNLVYQRDAVDSNGPAFPDGDVRALSDMREIFPERSRLIPGALRAPSPAQPGKSAAVAAIPEIVGQVFVPSGRISSSFGIKRQLKVVFSPSRPDHVVEKVAAPELVVTIDGLTGFTIKSTSLDTGLPLDEIAFDLEHDAEIRFGNADPPDTRRFLALDGKRPTDAQRLALLPPPDDPNLDPRDFRRDDDFELYYTLLEGAGAGPELPAPVKDQDPFLNGDDRNCYVVLVGGGG
jgi:hypothetical protein